MSQIRRTFENAGEKEPSGGGIPMSNETAERVGESTALYLFVAISAFFFMYVEKYVGDAVRFTMYGCGTVFLSVITIYLVRRRPALFRSLLFFDVMFLLMPLLLIQDRVLEMSFPGVHYAGPVLLYFFIVIGYPRLRRTVAWLATGRFDGVSVMLTATMIAFSAAGLMGWAFGLHSDLDKFTEMLPDWNKPALLLGGLGFAVSNSLVEELAFRGVLMDGLTVLSKRPCTVILIQAVLFGLWHLEGFPGGGVGASMVFAWGIFLGILRKRSGGMIAPIAGHICADLTIYFILFSIIGL
jgi:membrane protease YdiL (CAAX protease family)